jgi:hypothetical protein
MTGLIIACIRAGTAYSLDHVRRLREAVRLHLKRPYIMVCLTDQPERCEGVSFIDITEVGLTEPWAKLLLFEPSWREGHKVIYFDLHLDITGDITLLADVPGEFAIHDNVMVIGAGMASYIWTTFDRVRAEEGLCVARNDMHAIRMLCPDAAHLQRMLPKGFFRETVVKPLI